MDIFLVEVQCEEVYNEEPRERGGYHFVDVVPVGATYVGNDTWLGVDGIFYITLE